MQEEINKWLERFKHVFNSLGFDHVASCGCLTSCSCKSPREKMEAFLTEALTSAYEQGRKEQEQLLEEFSEYCHTRYLGCSQEENDKFSYSYDNEVVWMAKDYLQSLIK